MKSKHLVAALALILAALPAFAQTSYQKEYRLSTVVGTAFPWGKAGERWGDIVRQKTNGRINIKLYPGVSLVAGDQTREFTAIRQGVIDLAIGSTINWSPQIRELNLFSLPFLMPAILVLGLMSVFWSFNNFVYVWLATGAGPGTFTNVLATEVYLKAFVDFRLGYSSAIGMVMAVIMGAFGILYLRLVARQQLEETL